MTQEKELLLKDLCGRLPYGVMCKVQDGEEPEKLLNISLEHANPCIATKTWLMLYIGDVKPYLRPMSSMTEEEKEDFYQNCLDMDVEDIRYENDGELPLPYNQKDKFIWFENVYIDNVICAMDWLNAHHFDYRGLIEKGLALPAPEGMYNLKGE